MKDLNKLPSLDDPQFKKDVKKALVNDPNNAIDYESKKKLAFIECIMTKETEKEDGEKSLQVTGLNQDGLMNWLKHYVPTLQHELLPYPYKLDERTNLWQEQKGLTSHIYNAVIKYARPIFGENYGLNMLPDSVTKVIKTTAKDYEKLMETMTDPRNPLIEVQHPEEVPFRNGMYNFKDDTLREIKRSDYITSVLPYDLDQTATEDDPQVQYIKDFVTWLVGESTDLMMAYMGFMFYRSQSTIQTMMIFVNGKTANGGNGKGKMGELMQAMLGNVNNYSAIKMGDIANPKKEFVIKNLQHRYANFDMEASGDFLEDTAILKQLSSNDMITTNVKNKDYISFRSYARMVLATNKLPEYRDESDGIRDRWILVPFIQRVSDEQNIKLWNTPDAKFSDENKELNMYSDEALGKWAWVCIQRYKQLVKDNATRNPFKELMTTEGHEILTKMYTDNDPVAQFLDEYEYEITGNINDYVPKAQMYDDYKEYSAGATKTKNKFYKDLESKGAILATPDVKYPSRRIGGKMVKVLLGIRKLDVEEAIAEYDEQPF